MRIFEFIDKYCSDLVEAHKRKAKLVDLAEFPHDYTVTDVEGNVIPVINIDGVDVPIHDVFTLDRQDFIAIYKLPTAAEAYDNYVGNLEILEGEEALSRIRNQILAARENLAKDVELVTEV